MSDFLLLDVGNTRLKWAWSRAGDLANGGELHHGGRLTADELSRHLPAQPLPAAVWISCVGPAAVRETLIAWCSTRYGKSPVVVRSPARGNGVVNAYAQPERLGSDRWAALVAARARVGGPVCVVDAGTAVTVDLLAENGHHLGGYIVPGLSNLVQCINAITQITVAESQDRYSREPGQDTPGCVGHGAMAAVCALIESAVNRLERNTGRSVACLLTGGDAWRVGAALAIDHIIEPDLVLQGLARMARAGSNMA